MDPITINRLGQIRHQEIVDWATGQHGEPTRRWLPLLHDAFSLITRQARRFAQPAGRGETAREAGCLDCGA